MAKQWFEYDICVPFGNVNFDVSLHGSHDMDIAAPPNMPVTALLGGVVKTVSYPEWGISIGILLDTPYKGIAYMAYLHLSATPLVPGKKIKVGDIVGYVGGGNSEGQYAGTANPTGKNFLNDTFNSSRIQVGIALMRGPEYGVGTAWSNFPPIDTALDPTQLILDARKNVHKVSNKVKRFRDMWSSTVQRIDTGIYDDCVSRLDDFDPGVPLGGEIPTVDDVGDKILCQYFSNCRAEHKNSTTLFFDEENKKL